jgi:hypothetical protein
MIIAPRELILLDISLLQKLPHFQRSVTGQLHKINPAGKTTYVNICQWFRDLVRDELLTVNVHYR